MLGDRESIHGADLQSNQQLVDTATSPNRFFHGQCDPSAFRRSDLHWLEVPRQRSAPVKSQATNRSRRHGTGIEPVHWSLLGGGRQADRQEHQYCPSQYALDSHSP